MVPDLERGEKASSPDYHREIHEIISRDYGGDLAHTGRVVEPQTHGFYKNVGNPGLAGLTAHAVTLMLIGTSFMGWRGVTSPQVYVGNLFFCTGLYMLLSAIFCLIKGETFAYWVFCTFSGFYMSYGAILVPAFNVAGTYASTTAGSTTNAAAEYQSLAIFLLVWNGAFTTIWIASLRTNLALMIVFLGVFVGVFLLAGMYLQMAAVAQGDTTVATANMVLALSKAGGAFLFLSASSGFYLVFAQATESVGMPFTLPMGDLARFWPKKKEA